MNGMFCHEAKVNMTGHLTFANKSNGFELSSKKENKVYRGLEANITNLNE